MAAEAHVRLLEDEEGYHEGCPGCALQRRKIAARGAPKRELCYVAVLVLANGLPISSLFSFIYFMVRDFGVAKSDTHIGIYTGYLGSALMLGRSFTSAGWGMLADRYGRKLVMSFGTATIVVLNTTFGFSPNFWVAWVSRFLLGIFNGMMGPVQAYASEICSSEYQALGLSLVSTMWGVSLIIGPAIGGCLSQPADKYPSLFPRGSVFSRFPYALPCTCISACAVTGLILSFQLPESLHNHREISKIRHENCEDVSMSNNNDTQFKEVSICPMVKLEGTEEAKKASWMHWGVIASISLFCIYSLHDMAYNEIFSLWAVSPKEYGGLEITTSALGSVLAVSGIALLVFQLFAFAPLANRIGAIEVIRVATILTMPLVLIYPLIPRLHGLNLWIVLITVSVVKLMLTACIMTGSLMLINNSVGINQRGLINGVSMSCVSLFRAIGPASAGALFSWAQERMDVSFLPGMWMVFFLLDIIVGITWCITYEPMLPKSLLYPFPEQSRISRSKETEKIERPSSFTFE